MNNFLFGFTHLVLLFATSCGDQKAAVSDKPGVDVTVLVTQTSAYCGGAAPNKEITDRMNTPRPVDGKNVFVALGDMNEANDEIVFRGVTDKDGKVRMNIAPGTYYLVFDNKSDKNYYNELVKTYGQATAYYSVIDKDCLDQWFRNPELIMQVDAQHTEFSVNVYQPCEWNAIPCAQYNGPLPP